MLRFKYLPIYLPRGAQYYKISAIFFFYLFFYFYINYNQGGLPNAVLSVGDESRQVSDGHAVVLDGQLYRARVLQPADFDIRGHASAENHREDQPVRHGTRSAHGTEDSAPLLRDRLPGMHVDVTQLRLYRHFAQQDVG